MPEIESLKDLLVGKKATIEYVGRTTITFVLEDGKRIEIESVCDPDCEMFCSSDECDSDCEISDADCDAYLLAHKLYAEGD